MAKRASKTRQVRRQHAARSRTEHKSPWRRCNIAVKPVCFQVTFPDCIRGQESRNCVPTVPVVGRGGRGGKAPGREARPTIGRKPGAPGAANPGRDRSPAGAKPLAQGTAEVLGQVLRGGQPVGGQVQGSNWAARYKAAPVIGAWDSPAPFRVAIHKSGWVRVDLVTGPACAEGESRAAAQTLSSSTNADQLSRFAPKEPV